MAIQFDISGLITSLLNGDKYFLKLSNYFLCSTKVQGCAHLPSDSLSVSLRMLSMGLLHHSQLIMGNTYV